MPDPLWAQAAQAAPAAQPAATQQAAEEQAAPPAGAEVAAPAQGQVRQSKQELIDQRNSEFAADARRHAVEKERVRLQEHEDQMGLMGCDQAAWYEARGGAQRTGPGAGYGYFDSDLSNTDHQAERWGRNYRDVDAHG